MGKPSTGLPTTELRIFDILKFSFLNQPNSMRRESAFTAEKVKTASWFLVLHAVRINCNSVAGDKSGLLQFLQEERVTKGEVSILIFSTGYFPVFLIVNVISLSLGQRSNFWASVVTVK